MAKVKTAALGYPRIGEKREWKLLLESYWGGKTNREDFLAQMKELRIRRLKRLQASGIDYIPVGDFTLYDSMLDHSAAFGLIPDRFAGLASQDALDAYFAMARGASGAPACEMTKWFDTNYHYLVPEWTASSTPSLVRNPWLEAFLEAKRELGIVGRPVLIGPYTFVRLSKGISGGALAEKVLALVPVYIQAVSELVDAGAEWIQIDEPSLVTDVPAEHIELLRTVYEQIKAAAPAAKLLLQTYFGPVAHLEKIKLLPVDGIGLDFVRDGGANAEAIENSGWPADKTLGAGIVDGRGIWRVDPDAALGKLESLGSNVAPGKLILQPSCSLLHVPVSSKLETTGDLIVRHSFAFADEKLEELVALASVWESGKASARLEENRQALAALQAHPARNRAEASSSAAVRAERAPFEERRVLQQNKFKLPPLPTTTIGSLPQTADIRRARVDWRKGHIGQAKYEEILREKTELWIKRQEELGIDVLVHGEFERTDMVEHFGHLLDGYHFTGNGWVQSYGSRCVKPPVIYGDVVARGAMTVADTVYAQSLTSRPVKGMLTGPITMLAWSFSRDDLPKSEIAFQIARALNVEVLRLEEAGIGMIQVDEPALREIAPLRRGEWKEYLGWAVGAFRMSVSGVKNETQIHTHMCYCDFHEILPAIEAMDADVISLETSRSHGALVEALREEPYANGIGLGVYDIHSPVVPDAQEMLGVIRSALAVVPSERLWVNPDCGLKTRGEAEALAALKNMTEAASLARQELAVGK
ncbi:5-methyltetrahydropteroyltriglutamate--homocysteine S-methyltransferase [Cohnella thailandensis]|uniref:5-methyltetrahydropteroyltriglutamate--homocysteine methyltransferase n=1 Tax=Cohnella thailandensis TaxID=557557 RepID=A0A841SSV5_9BACL|nr:5-methyltetrahydropteroyltriglutamate--homocysteine S-methyltransferase [Cohnella thailandensis]MBB6633676.1 5-methyltetrahydropteroyltriglutamate--homocysteine S-methyltransferase [Cohnella thailandensis]MBP1976461.1 5-methyltetrahydropteroyltriglutamate--homocysteine methyltransferase [Cohnella thailandensis]